MPKIKPFYKRYKVEAIGDWVLGELAKQHKYQRQLAEVLGTTQQGVSYKIANNAFTYEDLLGIFSFLQTSDEQILKLLKVEQGV